MMMRLLRRLTAASSLQLPRSIVAATSCPSRSPALPQFRRTVSRLRARRYATRKCEGCRFVRLCGSWSQRPPRASRDACSWTRKAETAADWANLPSITTAPWKYRSRKSVREVKKNIYCTRTHDKDISTTTMEATQPKKLQGPQHHRIRER